MKGLEDQEGLSGKISEPLLEPGGMEQDSRVLILPVNGESRKITQILSNGTSLKILELLGEKSLSATDIAEKLNLPLTTVKYNLDSLVESDLIKVKQIKWSQKGRQVKIYESMEKLIVLVPSKSTIDRISIINMLQKYIGVIGAAIFAAAGIEYFSAYMQAKRIFDAAAPSPDATGSLNDSVSGPSSIPPESLTHAGGMHGLYDALSLHPGIWFLFGCIFVVFLLIVREIYYKKRTK